MESSNASLINIVVWAESRDSAAQLASTFTGAEEVNAVWSGVSEGSSIKAYVRYPGSASEASPIGNTDVLVVSICAESAFLDEAKFYVSSRKAIPFKFVTSSDDLSDLAKELGSDFITSSEIGASKVKFVTAVTQLDATLRSAFSALDLNNNGFITSEELVKASSSLGHELNSEEAHLIVSTLSKDGNINFTSFKSWWVMGRGDFNLFRRLVQLELSVGGLMKQGSNLFNDYVNKLQVVDTSEDTYVGRFNVGPTEDFEAGIGLSMEIAAGQDFDAIFNLMPDYLKSSPFCYGLELRVTDEAAGAMIKQTLDGLNDMASAVSQVDQIKQAGLQVNVRHVGLSVFIDCSFGGSLSDIAMQYIDLFNINQLNFAGIGNSSLFSGIKINDLLTGNMSHIISKLVQLKIQSHSEFSGIKRILGALPGIAKAFDKHMPIQVKQFFEFLRLLGAIRSIGYEFKYDAKEIESLAKDLLGDFAKGKTEEPEESALPFEGQLNAMQNMGVATIDNFKPMIDSVIEPFKPALEALDLDKIGVYTCAPKMRVFSKVFIHLPGLTAFVHEKILN